VIELNLSFFIQVINFIVLGVILNFVLYKPLRKVLSERRQEIETSRSRAESVDREVQEKMALYETHLHTAKTEAGSQRMAALKQAQLEETALLEKARSEAAATLATIRNTIAQESLDARESLQKHAQALSTDICKKILGRSL